MRVFLTVKMPSASFPRALKLSLTLVALVATWELLCRALNIPVFLVPAPSQVAWRLYEKRDLYLIHTWTTLYETTAGFLLAVVFGILCAAIIVVIPKLRDIVMPLLLVAQLVPKVAIAPLLLIWFGYGLFPKVLVAFLVAFFPLVVNGASGLYLGHARRPRAAKPLADLLEVSDPLRPARAVQRHEGRSDAGHHRRDHRRVRRR